MNRTEAVTLLKEIVSHCEFLNPDCVTLDDSKVGEASVGYRIVIKGNIDSTNRSFIQHLAMTHKLAVKEESNQIVIFRLR